jgi:D-lactate dehydrogenase (cytochrome)
MPIIPFGAGTSIEGNTIPVRGGVTVDLSEMNAIVAVNARISTARSRPACAASNSTNMAARYRLVLPDRSRRQRDDRRHGLHPGIGTNAVRYGTMREAILSLRIVTPDGRDIRTSRRARKSAAGYDLTRLMIGSEGTLGIITEVTLRLHGIPEAISAAVCSFETLGGAVDTVVQSIQLGIPLARSRSSTTCR